MTALNQPEQLAFDTLDDLILRLTKAQASHITASDVARQAAHTRDQYADTVRVLERAVTELVTKLPIDARKHLPTYRKTLT